MEHYAFRAVYGNTTIKGHDFQGVADALVERGFDMSSARELPDGSLSIPHREPRRRAAKLSFHKEERQPDEIDKRLEMAYRAVFSGAMVPGIQTRACGAMHSDGVFCIIPVLFESLHCGCGDMVFPHEQPHEACDDNGVRYRWEEVLVIQDLEYDTYSTGEAASA